MRFYQDLLLNEELMKEGNVIAQQKIKVHMKMSLFWVFMRKGEKESPAMDESSLKSPIQMYSLLIPPFEETMEVQVQVKEDKTILTLMEKDDKLKPNLEVMLPIVWQPHCYTFHWLDLGIKVNTTKQALLSFLMRKFRDEALY